MFEMENQKEFGCFIGENNNRRIDSICNVR